MIRKILHKVLLRGGRRRKKPAARAMRLPAARYDIDHDRISHAALTVCTVLQRKNYQAYIVGGAVRDLMLGVAPKDYDVATNATPEAVRALFRRSRIIGRRFKIVHVRQGREIIEVTTFRGQQDGYTDEYGRVLHDNTFGTRTEDAMRRDFTVNALYYDPVAECIVDDHGGCDDIEHKRLRIIGDARTRYREDPVRMLRAIRLAAKLGLDIDPATKAPIRELAPLLVNVPDARLFDETLKLLLCGHALSCLKALRAEGLHHDLLPLLDDIAGEDTQKRFVELALANTDERIRSGKTASPSFLFATLLWHKVLQQQQVAAQSGLGPRPALLAAIDVVLDKPARSLAITRRISYDIRDIWTLQPRFEYIGRNAAQVLAQPRFRAARDFLLLRAEAGEINAELVPWWDEFAHANEQQRSQLLQNLPAGARTLPRKRRRRKKRSAAAKTTTPPATPPDPDASEAA